MVTAFAQPSTCSVGHDHSHEPGNKSPATPTNTNPDPNKSDAFSDFLDKRHGDGFSAGFLEGLVAQHTPAAERDGYRQEFAPGRDPDDIMARAYEGVSEEWREVKDPFADPEAREQFEMLPGQQPANKNTDTKTQTTEPAAPEAAPYDPGPDQRALAIALQAGNKTQLVTILARLTPDQLEAVKAADAKASGGGPDALINAIKKLVAETHYQGTVDYYLKGEQARGDAELVRHAEGPGWWWFSKGDSTLLMEILRSRAPEQIKSAREIFEREFKDSNFDKMVTEKATAAAERPEEVPTLLDGSAAAFKAYEILSARRTLGNQAFVDRAVDLLAGLNDEQLKAVIDFFEANFDSFERIRKRLNSEQRVRLNAALKLGHAT